MLLILKSEAKMVHAKYKVAYFVLSLALGAVIGISEIVRSRQEFQPIPQWQESARKTQCRLMENYMIAISRIDIKKIYKFLEKYLEKDFHIIPKNLSVLDMPQVTTTRKKAHYEHHSDTLIVYRPIISELGEFKAYLWKTIWEYTFPKIRDALKTLAPEEYQALCNVLIKETIHQVSLDLQDLFLVSSTSLSKIEEEIQKMAEQGSIWIYVNELSKLKKNTPNLINHIRSKVELMKNHFEPIMNKTYCDKAELPNRAMLLRVGEKTTKRIWAKNSNKEDRLETYLKKIGEKLRENIKTIYVICETDDIDIHKLAKRVVQEYKSQCTYKETRKHGNTEVFLARLNFD